MFCDIVENYTRLCRFANNQWHVPDYGGIEAARGVQTLNGSGVQRLAKIDNEAHLQNCLAQSRDAMSQMRRIAEAQELPLLPAAPEIAQAAPHPRGAGSPSAPATSTCRRSPAPVRIWGRGTPSSGVGEGAGGWPW